MDLKVCKLEYSDNIREKFLSETKYFLNKLIQSNIYSEKKLQFLLDEAGKRLYITSNSEYKKDRNITSKIKASYLNEKGVLDQLFKNERNLRLVNFLNINIPPLELTLKLVSYPELFYRKLLSWGIEHLFIFRLRKFCFQKIGVGFRHHQLAVIAPGVSVDRLSPGLIFIDDHSLIGARTILQTHGMKSDKGYGLSYVMGPIYIMEGADIGSDCIILPGSIIGKDCGAYPMTVIKKDISPVYIDNKSYPVTYNEREEYPYRINLSLIELATLGLSSHICFKNLKDNIVPKN